MEKDKRGTFILAVFLIGLGVIFLLLNFIPGWKTHTPWSLVFFILAAGFITPPIAFPAFRSGLAALFIPGVIMAVLGLIFTYNIYSQDWSMWAFAWLLISSASGAGIALASWYGSWGRTPTLVGIWIMIGSAAIFAFFGFIFGGTILKTLTAVLLILLGLLMIFRSLAKK